jgi:hypothetical protein
MLPRNFVCLWVLVLCASPAFAADAMDRAVVETRVRREVLKDLTAQHQPPQLEERTCLDNRPVKGFQGDIVEYWVNLECSFSGVTEAVQAQRLLQDVCIVVRHIPSDGFQESRKKALSYEALKKFSANAANFFWDRITPRAVLAIPAPYEGALLAAFQEAAIDPDAFGNALTTDAVTIVNQDMLGASQGGIRIAPTWVISGVRLPACPFKAQELGAVIQIARDARAGSMDASERLITIITNGMMGDKIL